MESEEMKSRTKNMDEYQELARGTAIYPDQGNNIIYPVLGLCGESGEVAEKIKKMIRDDGGIISETKKNEIVKEIGDVMWYIANICCEIGVTMNEVAGLNLEKLYSRGFESLSLRHFHNIFTGRYLRKITPLFLPKVTMIITISPLVFVYVLE